MKLKMINPISEGFAKELLRVIYALDDDIGELDKICSSLPDGPEKSNFIEALGNVTGKIYSGMLVPIYGIHTNLGTPDEPGAWLHDKA